MTLTENISSYSILKSLRFFLNKYTNKNINDWEHSCTIKEKCPICFKEVYLKIDNQITDNVIYCPNGHLSGCRGCLDILNNEINCVLCRRPDTIHLQHIRKRKRKEFMNRYSTHVMLMKSNSTFYTNMINLFLQGGIPFAFDYSLDYEIEGTMYMIDTTEQFVVYYDFVNNKKLRKGIPSMTGIIVNNSICHSKRLITVNKNYWKYHVLYIKDVYSCFDPHTERWVYKYNQPSSSIS